MAQQGVAQVHYFEPGPYAEVINVLQEFAGFVLGEVAKPEPLDQNKLGNMLNVYIQNCLRKGPQPGQEAPTGSTCQHAFIKGSKEGQICGKPANYVGVDGRPKCSTHKTSRPAKGNISEAGAIASGAASGQTFSYSANAGKGKTVPQSLTSIQQAISEQAGPGSLTLFQTADGKFFHKDSGIVFENRPNEGWIAVGVLNGNNVDKLSANETYVCYGNKWRWDPACVVDPAAVKHGHSLVIGAGASHPLVQGNNALVQQKIHSVTSNMNNNNDNTETM